MALRASVDGMSDHADAAQPEHAPDRPGPALDDLVDRGTWATFTRGLAGLLRERRPSPGAPGTGLLLLLTAPEPVVEPVSARRGALARFLNRHEPEPSPEVPGMVLSTAADGTRIDIPALDARGRGLLGREHRDVLESLGWERREDVLSRTVGDEEEAAAAAVRVLIEVLAVAHPADLDSLLDPEA